MLKFLKRFFGERGKNMFATIANTDEGFVLCDRHGLQIEGTTPYSRRRDAVRGAKRRGLVLA